jgi:hypothetical protein
LKKFHFFFFFFFFLGFSRFFFSFFFFFFTLFFDAGGAPPCPGTVLLGGADVPHGVATFHTGVLCDAKQRWSQSCRRCTTGVDVRFRQCFRQRARGSFAAAHAQSCGQEPINHSSAAAASAGLGAADPAHGCVQGADAALGRHRARCGGCNSGHDDWIHRRIAPLAPAAPGTLSLRVPY